MDEIKRRLAEIDKQLQRSPAHYFNQTVNIAPLLFCAAGMIAGIIVQDNLPVPVWVWLAGLMLCSAIAIVSLVIHRSRLAGGIPLLVLVSFVCLGAIRMISFNSARPNDIRNSVGSEQTLATLRGVIITEPYIDRSEWRFSRFTHTDPATSFYFKATEAEAVTGWTKTSGLVRVRVSEPVMDLKAGDNIEMFCRLDRFAAADNPGEFDTATYMARKGVYVAAAVESREAIKLLKDRPISLFTKIKTGVRKRATEALLGGSQPKDEEDKLLLALVLGHKTNIDRETFEAFRKTGLLHFICLSGMNFGIVIGFVWWICKTAGLLKRGRAIVCMLTAVLFLLAVPENAPAFRAAIMCFSFCGAFTFRRTSNSFNSLALAAIVLLILKPTGLFEVGWQLSFASVLGILLFAEPIQIWMREKASYRFESLNKPGFAIKVASVIISSCAVSLAAWMTSAGILVYNFYSINWLTSFWTVLAAPLIGLVSFLGYLKLFVAFFLPSVAAVLGMIVTYLSMVLIWIVKLFAALDISTIYTGKVDGLVIVLFYALVVFVFLFPMRGLIIKKMICTAATALLIAILAIPQWQRAYSGDLIITTLDVGHGQALLAEMPNGGNVLFDAGSLSRNDIGSRVVSPFLLYRGISKLDAAILSHGDIDHINGLPEISENYRLESYYAGKAFLEDNRPTVKFLKELIEVSDINKLPQAFGPATIKVLWPDGNAVENNGLSDNNKALVIMIEYAGRNLLISSDIENFAQKELLRLYPDLKADVLIAPHHGSTKTLEQNFIESIEPNIVICSCNKTQYDKRQVIQPDKKFKSYYTGRDGAVTIRVTKQGELKLNTFVTRCSLSIGYAARVRLSEYQVIR